MSVNMTPNIYEAIKPHTNNIIIILQGKPEECATLCTMAALSKLFNIIESDDGNWVDLEDFFTYLNAEYQTYDKCKKVRRRQILNDGKCFKNGSKVSPVDSSRTWISLSSLIRFTFKHVEDWNGCRLLAKEIETCLLKTSKTSQVHLHDKTTLDLYRLLVRNGLRITSIQECLLPAVDLESVSIPTLQAVHRSEFQDDCHWKTICLFEYHFSQEDGILDLEYAEQMKKKWEFYHSCMDTKRVASQLAKLTKQSVSHHVERQQHTSLERTPKIKATWIHQPEVIDQDILSYLQEHFPSTVQYVFCARSPQTLRENMICINVELCDSLDQTLDTDLMSTCIQHLLARKHNVLCQSVTYYRAGSFTLQSEVSRFHMQDNIFQGKLRKQTVLSWYPLSDGDFQLEEPVSLDMPDRKCRGCFGEDTPEPLCARKLEIEKEWLLHTPLQVQMLLESFINMDSMYKVNDKSDFLKKKLRRLYGNFHSSLNVRNKNYVGILQETASQDLLTSYHSISSTFDITSSMGATLSLKAIEQQMKKLATDDMTYYNAYVKEHDLTYCTLAGEVTQGVNIQDSFVTLCLDNLVRIKLQKDTNPGECRSHQICTLPITLQGMPKDSAIVETWHDEGCTEHGEDSCSCRIAPDLNKDEVKTLLLTLTPKELQAKENFNKLVTWGCPQIWQNIQGSELWGIIHQSGHGDEEESCDNQELGSQEEGTTADPAIISSQHLASPLHSHLLDHTFVYKIWK